MDYLIYLAGPITGLSWKDATEWRKNLIERFKDAGKATHNYIALSPLRGKEYLENETDIKDGYMSHKMSTPKAITERDLNDVRRSDLLIVNLKNATKISIGTIIEIGAAKVLNIPIILIMEEPTRTIVDEGVLSEVSIAGEIPYAAYQYNKNVHDHSMVRESAYVIVEDIDEAFEIAIHLLGS